MSFPPIEALLPHRPPMCWLDAVIGRCGDGIQCRLKVRTDHVFVRRGRVEAVTAIEWMAQAVGALVGLIDRERERTPRPGYLVAVPEASFEVEAFAVDDELDVFATPVWGSDELASFECRVEKNGSVAVRARLSVYRQPLAQRASP